MKTFFLLVCLAVLAMAQSQLTFFTIPDVSMTGSAVQLSATGTARVCQLVAPAGNAAVLRWGDSLVTTSRGSIIAAGGGQMVPPTPTGGQPSVVFQLNTVYLIGTNGDKITATCWR